MTESILKNSNRVSFTLHDVKIYAMNKFQSVTIIAVVNYRAVRSFGIDPIYLYNACAPHIPNGLNSKVEDWEFIVVELEEGGNTVIPIPAIQTDSIKLSKPLIHVFQVEGVNPEDIEKIIFAINSLGYDRISHYSK